MTAATDLNVLSDTLNEVIERAEEVFVLVGATVPAHVEVQGRTLWFERLGDRWRFTVHMDGKDPLPLRNASRQIRIEAAREIPRLYEKLCAQREVLAEDARKVVESLEAFVSRLESGTDGVADCE